MSLLVRISFALMLVCAVGATITGVVCRVALESSAEREIGGQG